jgi:hypothetical protein
MQKARGHPGYENLIPHSAMTGQDRDGQPQAQNGRGHASPERAHLTSHVGLVLGASECRVFAKQSLEREPNAGVGVRSVVASWGGSLDRRQIKRLWPCASGGKTAALSS